MKKWSSPLFLFRRTFTLMVVITSIIIAVLYLAALYSGATTTATTTRPMAVNRIHVLSAAAASSARHSTRPLAAAVGTLAKLVHP